MYDKSKNNDDCTYEIESLLMRVEEEQQKYKFHHYVIEDRANTPHI
jgi:hypothetical protein